MNNFRIGSARELTKDGTWFRDSAGRYVLFRGINFASRSKLPPYLPIAPLDKKTIDLNELKKELNKAKSQFEYLKESWMQYCQATIDVESYRAKT